MAGPILHDETVFVPHNYPVECISRIVGVVVAHTRRQALAAANAVKVTYADPPADATGAEKGIYTVADLSLIHI